MKFTSKNGEFGRSYLFFTKKKVVVSQPNFNQKNNKFICLNDKKTISKNIKGNYIELKDSFAKILEGKVVRN